MNRKRITLITAVVLFCFSITGCGITADLEDLRTSKFQELENTDGNDGGTTGTNPPPPPN